MAVTIRLTVRTAVWRAHVAQVVRSVDGLVPVIKGNGYGFGRPFLADIAAEFSDTVAVGTVHELAGLPDGLVPLVLTPTLRAPDTDRAVLTVGRREHVVALRHWGGRVVVKLESDMLRYGGDVGLIRQAQRAGLDVVGVALHPPLAGSDAERAEAIAVRLTEIDPALTVWVSHLAPTTYEGLPRSHRYRLRLGTALWHGDKSALHLDADVLDVRQVAAGTSAGYQLGPVPDDGHLVMVGAGTANGVTPLPDGRSPFHHQRTRLSLHEFPHMHTSMLFVPSGAPVPCVGDFVDLQRPLTMTLVDEYRWI